MIGTASSSRQGAVPAASAIHVDPENAPASRQGQSPRPCRVPVTTLLTSAERPAKVAAPVRPPTHAASSGDVDAARKGDCPRRAWRLRSAASPGDARTVDVGEQQGRAFAGEQAGHFRPRPAPRR